MELVSTDTQSLATASEAVRLGKQAIIETWLSAVRSEIGAYEQISNDSLVNNLPEWLENLADLLQSQGSEEFIQKSADLSGHHGSQRADLSSLSISHVIREYRILRRVLLEKLDLSRCLSLGVLQMIDDSIDEGMFQATVIFADINQARLVATQDKLKAALEFSKRQTTKYEAALRATGDVIWDWDMQANTITSNRAIATTFLHSLETVATSLDWWLDKIHPQQTEQIRKSLEEFIASDEQVWRAEYKFLKGNGDYADVVNQGYALRNTKGEPERILGAMQDVTGRKRLEQTLRKANEELESRVQERTVFLNAILENLEDGISACDATGKVTLANRVARNFFGPGISRPYNNNEWYRYSRAYTPDSEQEIPKGDLPLYRALRGEVVRNFELIYELYNGDRRYLVSDAQPLTGKNGESLGALVVMHDKTREREAMARTASLEESNESLQKSKTELQKSNVELENFAAVAAHDLKSPLNSITQFAELLADEYRGKLGGDADQIIDFITKAGHRMRKLVDSLLVYAKSGANLKIVRGLCAQRVVDAATMNLTAQIKATGARILVGELPRVDADEDRLLQVFQNLLANSLKYAKHDVTPEVHIFANEEKDQWVFTVRDNGVGIDDREWKSVFDLFSRLRSTEEKEGSGVGLAVCKKIVEAHGGRIWMDSKKGTGTSVHFSLPKSSDPPSDQ